MTDLTPQEQRELYQSRPPGFRNPHRHQLDPHYNTFENGATEVIRALFNMPDEVTDEQHEFLMKLRKALGLTDG